MKKTSEKFVDCKMDWKSAKIMKNRKPSPCGSGLTPLNELRDSRITAIGMVDADKYPNCYIAGGLIVAYIPLNKKETEHRIVVGFTEMGICVEWQGVK